MTPWHNDPVEDPSGEALYIRDEESGRYWSPTPSPARGGWSWYTGSAAWMYRLLTETLLGVHREGDRLRLKPRPPKAWDSYKIHYRYYDTVYHITLTRDSGEPPPHV